MRRTCALIALIAVSASCAHGPMPAPKLPEPKVRAPRPAGPPDWFWEPVDADVRTPSRKPIDLPLAETELLRVEGANRVWDALAPEARERLLRDGVLVVGSDSDPPEKGERAVSLQNRRWESIGALYTDLRAQRVPHIITLDALYELVHFALQRALADVEERALAPALDELIEKLERRLHAEDARVGTELAEAYRLARGVVSVARALKDGAPSVGLDDVVAEERGHVEGHTGISISPLLGVTLDYARFEVPSAAMRPGLFRALAWLGAAPLALVARTEVSGSPINVAQARLNTRAAMILARACDRDIDGSLYTTYTRIRRLLTFVWGPSDDLSLDELDELATSVGVDLTKPEDIANVTRVDKVRARARAGRAPAAYDGSGGVGRGGIGVRVFGGHASADSLVLQSLVGASAGLADQEAASASIDRVRNGERVLPSTLDVIAWLGARESRSVLHESHADAFDHYDAALTNIKRATDQRSTLHASVHGSLVESLLEWATAPEGFIARATPSAARARIESMLAGWTLVRHVGGVLSRTNVTPPALPTDLRVPDPPVPVFVEPMPTVVARLVAVVRQLRRGLETLGQLPPSATATLLEVEDILHTALIGAERHASDEPLAPEEAAALASLPARLARIQEASMAEHGPVIAVVYSDPKSRRVLATATGRIEPVLMIAREANSDDPLLVVGAHVAHHELVEGFEPTPGVMHGVWPALTDASWRARLKRNPPPRPAWVSSFRWTEPSAIAAGSTPTVVPSTTKPTTGDD